MVSLLPLGRSGLHPYQHLPLPRRDAVYSGGIVADMRQGVKRRHVFRLWGKHHVLFCRLSLNGAEVAGILVLADIETQRCAVPGVERPESGRLLT
jgi:hypothetical protein